MSIAPLTFTGVSTFSTDFQTILTRAVSIANLPVTALTNQLTKIQSEKVLAANLSSAIADLGNSLGSLAGLGKTKGMVATSTDSSIVTATAAGASSGASYTITNVTSIARAASETSAKGYAGMQYSAAYTAMTPSDTESLTFTINDAAGNPQTKTVTLAASLDAAGASAAINTALGVSPALAGITATADGTGRIAFSSNSLTSFTVGFGAVATGGFTDKGTVQTSAATPVSSTGSVELNIGGTKTTIVLAADKNNLAGLSNAINALNLGVTASILATGTGNFPNYLTLSANQTGLTTLALKDGGTSDLLSTTNQGANTVFQLNGLNVTKPGTVVNDVIPGVSFTFNGKTTGTQSVGVSLVSDRNKIASALQDIVAKYNVVSGQINSQIGSAGGLLIGNSMIGQTRQALFSLANSSGSGGSVRGLTDLGIELSNSGVMSFNSTTFNALSDSQITDAYSFLGSTTTGPKAMQAEFTQLSDSATGAIKMQQDQWDASDKRISNQVDALTARINAMQATLQKKLQMADTLLAGLTSQQGILTSSISSLNFSSGYTAKANA